MFYIVLLISRLYIIHTPIVILYIPPYPYNLLVLPDFTTQGVMLLQRDDVFRFFAPAIASMANCQSSIGKYFSRCFYSFVTSSIITLFCWILTITLHLSSSIVRNLPISSHFHLPHLEKWPPKLLEVWSCWMSATSQGPQHRPPWIGRDGAAELRGSCDARSGINGGPMMGLLLGDWITLW